MKTLIIGCLLLSSIAFATVWDSGVKQETDEFTNSQSCLQRVDNDSYTNTGIAMSIVEGEPVIYIRRQIIDYDNVYNIYGNVGGEKVYIKFADGTVETLEPVLAQADFDAETESAAIIDIDLTYKLFSLSDELRVRFEGDGSKDFTIQKGVFAALAAGFGNTCMPIYEAGQ